MKKKHYALGLCQNCYQMNYIKKQCEQENVSKGSSVNSTKVLTISNDETNNSYYLISLQMIFLTVNDNSL